MKIMLPVALALVLLYCCKYRHKDKAIEPAVLSKSEVTTDEKQSFFPVSAYIKGQIFEITQKGINPLKYRTLNDHTDSAWLKTEELSKAFAGFLNPDIDSVNLTSLFSESKFMDRSINAFTFSYDPRGPLPDSMNLRHWDVYIDPATGKVRRIYMVKSIGANKTIQLTWQSNKWCKTTIIITNPDGTSAIESEEKINWDF